MPNVSFQTIKNNSVETKVLRVKHKPDENLHIIKVKSDKKSSKQQPTSRQVVKAESEDSSEDDSVVNSSNRSSRSSNNATTNKKENKTNVITQNKEITKSCPDIQQKFHKPHKQQKHAEIRNKLKIYPTTIMSVSQSDSRTVINQVDVTTNLMITSSSVPSPKVQKKTKHKSKKEVASHPLISEEKTTRDSLTSLNSAQSKKSDSTNNSVKNEKNLNEKKESSLAFLKKSNSIESDLGPDEKQKTTVEACVKSSDDGDYVLEDSEIKARQTLLKLIKAKQLAKKQVRIDVKENVKEEAKNETNDQANDDNADVASNASKDSTHSTSKRK